MKWFNAMTQHAVRAGTAEELLLRLSADLALLDETGVDTLACVRLSHELLEMVEHLKEHPEEGWKTLREDLKDADEQIAALLEEVGALELLVGEWRVEAGLFEERAESLAKEIQQKTKTCAVAERPLSCTRTVSKAGTMKERDMSKSLFVEEVSTNIKGGFTAKLGLKTLIVGPNYSRKTAVVQAVEFAIRQRISDIGGKDEIGSGVELLPLGDGGSVESRVTFSDGRRGHALVLANGAGKAKRMEHSSEVDGVSCAIHELRELFGKKGEPAQRQFLLEQMEGGLTLKAIKEMLGDYYVPDFMSIYAGVQGETLTPIKALVAVHQSCGQKQRLASSDEKAAARLVADLAGAHTGSLPSESEVAAAKQRAEDLLEAWQSIVPLSSTPASDTKGLEESVAGWAAEVARQRALAETANADLAVALRALEDAPEVEQSISPEQRERLEAMLKMLEVQQGLYASGNLKCVLCSADIADVEATIGATYRAIQAALPADEPDDRGLREAEVRRAQQAKTAAHARWVEAHDTHTKWIKHLESAVTADAKEGNEAERAEAQAVWRSAQADSVRMEKARGSYDAVSAARAQESTRREDKDRYKRLGEQLVRVMGEVLASQKGSFEARVQKYLADRFEFGLQLLDGKRKVCRVGFMREGRLHTALSGVEWTNLLLALASAITEGEEYALLIPEERAFDAENLALTMRALSKSNAQILLTSPIAPKGRCPAGWTILKTSDLGERAK